MSDNGNYEELYPIEQRDWNQEQTRFKDIMREVVYRTKGIYFDGVQDTEDEQAVYCQLWTQQEGDTGEWMRWYAIDKVSLRQLDRERLITDAIQVCSDMRDGKNAMRGKAVS